MKYLLAAIILCLPSCENFDGGGITLDPFAGICYRSADGKYAVCANPLTKPVSYSIRATVPGGVVQQMSYDSVTQSWRATMPDGSTAVYDKNGLRFEPALPTK